MAYGYDKVSASRATSIDQPRIADEAGPATPARCARAAADLALVTGCGDDRRDRDGTVIGAPQGAVISPLAVEHLSVSPRSVLEAADARHQDGALC